MDRAALETGLFKGIKTGTKAIVLAGTIASCAPANVNPLESAQPQRPIITSVCQDKVTLADIAYSPNKPSNISCIHTIKFPGGQKTAEIIDTGKIVTAYLKNGDSIIKDQAYSGKGYRNFQIDDPKTGKRTIIDLDTDPIRVETIDIPKPATTSTKPATVTSTPAKTLTPSPTPTRTETPTVTPTKPPGALDKAERLTLADTVTFTKMYPDSIRYWTPEILKWSKETEIPAEWYFAIMANESLGDPNIKSGDDFGLFQINDWWWGKTPEKTRFNPEVNAKKFAEVLGYIFTKYPDATNYRKALIYTYGEINAQTVIDLNHAGETLNYEQNAKSEYAWRVANLVAASGHERWLQRDVKKWLDGLKNKANNASRIFAFLPRWR